MLFGDHGHASYLVRLPPAELSSRLAASVGKEGWLADLGDRAVVGEVNERSFRLCMPSVARNSFRPNLYGRIEATPDGSRVLVRIGLHPLVKPFMLVWFGSVTLFGLLALWVAFTDYAWSKPPPPGHRRELLMVPPLMFAFGVALVGCSRWLARSQERRLMAFADQLWGPRVETP